jgi:hypothetical protein
MRKPLSSAGALASITGSGVGNRRRKVKVNDENKENSQIGVRKTGTARAVGVNGSGVEGKKPMPLGVKVERGRLPLKELPINGFVEKMEGAASVEVVVFPPQALRKT